MCTAATYKTEGFYFGRTLDYEFSYGEKVTVTPRSYPFRFADSAVSDSRFAIIGIAHIADGYPLYYDGVNEKGLAMAGLNFVGNAVYFENAEGVYNVPQFDFIPWILTQCGSVNKAEELLKKTNITGTPFSERLPASQLHWMIADKKRCIVVESVADGLKVYDNPAGVLTNNPPFESQMFSLNNYMNLSAKNPENHFCCRLPLHAYSRGMGAMGLPGDISSQSRFVRASFVRGNSVSGTSELESVSQFFHILGSVEQVRGCCEVKENEFEVTLYTSCCSADKGIYYYTTYDNHQITAVDMHKENLDGAELACYPIIYGEQIFMQN